VSHRAYIYFSNSVDINASEVNDLTPGQKFIIIIRPHRRTTYVDAAYCYYRPSIAWSVDVCHSRESAKTAEPTEMPFGMLSLVDPWDHVLDGVQIPQQEVALLGKCLARWKG